MSRYESVLPSIVLAACVLGSPAYAQATRTWVSGVGSDSNSCSRTAPCQTFAAAISQTSAGGEINVLDPGGFGSVTITKALSIYNDGVGEAGVLASGANGITIAAGAADVVNLRGLIFNGLNAGSPSGIQIISVGRVSIQNCVIQGFATGVSATPSGGTVNVKIQDTTIINNGSGVNAKPTGGATLNMSIDRSRVDNNSGGGVKADGTGGGTVNIALTDSSVSLNASNAVNSVGGASGNTKIDVMRAVIVSNGLAATQSNNSNGGTSTLTIGSSLLSNNGAATNIVATGALLTYQNNQLTGPLGTGFSSTIGPQ
jgi:hypothetical protein